nr:MAG TPA: hypothetical protein [Caudoviricetes sp.]
MKIPAASQNGKWPKHSQPSHRIPAPARPA